VALLSKCLRHSPNKKNKAAGAVNLECVELAPALQFAAACRRFDFSGLQRFLIAQIIFVDFPHEG